LHFGKNQEYRLENVAWKASYWYLEVEKSIEKEDNPEVLRKYFEKNDIVIMSPGKRELMWTKIGHIAQYVATHSPIPVIFVSSLKKRWYQRVSRK
ncbi:hypothetical protein B6U71_03745, partial [Euryarchaeota archaeon ex4484_178]